MNSISTKTGDKGETSLANGQRVSKTSLVMQVIGEVDELNSWLGLIVAYLRPEFIQEANRLETFQQDLYEISAVLAQSPKVEFDEKRLTELETYAENLQNSMAEGWHTKFLYPGGTKLGGYLDLARSVSRRCERSAFALNAATKQSTAVLQYFNRLSDCLYLLRCSINLQQHHPEKEFSSKK